MRPASVGFGAPNIHRTARRQMVSASKPFRPPSSYPRCACGAEGWGHDGRRHVCLACHRGDAP